ncbi:unnamed protein product [Pleuronectes platessa]|uniref:Uncharacterized protein n=1 Tax=Pleuronectes platessa TaxID=8262 RepID=A0A9N7W1Z4_PLEPL|nr:unnamed protein product [Pleuronectes platessa]
MLERGQRQRDNEDGETSRKRREQMKTLKKEMEPLGYCLMMKQPLGATANILGLPVQAEEIRANTRRRLTSSGDLTNHGSKLSGFCPVRLIRGPPRRTNQPQSELLKAADVQRRQTGKRGKGFLNAPSKSNRKHSLLTVWSNMDAEGEVASGVVPGEN